MTLGRCISGRRRERGARRGGGAHLRLYSYVLSGLSKLLRLVMGGCMHRPPASEGGCRGDTGRRLWLGCGCGSIAFTSHAYCAVSDPQLRFPTSTTRAWSCCSSLSLFRHALALRRCLRGSHHSKRALGLAQLSPGRCDVSVIISSASYQQQSSLRLSRSCEGHA